MGPFVGCYTTGTSSIGPDVISCMGNMSATGHEDQHTLSGFLGRDCYEFQKKSVQMMSPH